MERLKDIRIWDNEGETFDRYTVIIAGTVYAMSANPNSPRGFNQYVGENLCPIPVWGKQVPFKSLPKEVQRAIKLRREH
jgi:hypothetical protein